MELDTEQGLLVVTDGGKGSSGGGGNSGGGGLNLGIGIAVEVVYGRKFVVADIIAFLGRRIKNSEVRGWREGVGELKAALLAGEIMVDS